jgi:hypothetical protein
VQAALLACLAATIAAPVLLVSSHTKTEVALNFVDGASGRELGVLLRTPYLRNSDDPYSQVEFRVNPTRSAVFQVTPTFFADGYRMRMTQLEGKTTDEVEIPVLDFSKYQVQYFWMDDDETFQSYATYREDAAVYDYVPGPWKPVGQSSLPRDLRRMLRPPADPSRFFMHDSSNWFVVGDGPASVGDTPGFRDDLTKLYVDRGQVVGRYDYEKAVKFPADGFEAKFPAKALALLDLDVWQKKIYACFGFEPMKKSTWFSWLAQYTGKVYQLINWPEKPEWKYVCEGDNCKVVPRPSWLK